jgi:uncharacterized protein YsxB (DUF464 family)
MTEVTVYRDRSGKILSYRIQGHSGYAPLGTDIVCAAISTLGQTTAMGLKQIVGVKTQVVVDESIPDYQCYYVLQDVNGKDKEIATLLETFCGGVRIIAEDYPDYVKLIEKEVM